SASADSAVENVVGNAQRRTSIESVFERRASKPSSSRPRLIHPPVSRKRPHAKAAPRSLDGSTELSGSVCDSLCDSANQHRWELLVDVGVSATGESCARRGSFAIDEPLVGHLSRRDRAPGRSRRQPCLVKGGRWPSTSGSTSEPPTLRSRLPTMTGPFPWPTCRDCPRETGRPRPAPGGRSSISIR